MAKLPELQKDEMAIWWDGKNILGRIDEKASWLNGKLTKPPSTMENQNYVAIFSLFKRAAIF